MGFIVCVLFTSYGANLVTSRVYFSPVYLQIFHIYICIIEIYVSDCGPF